MFRTAERTQGHFCLYFIRFDFSDLFMEPAFLHKQSALRTTVGSRKKKTRCYEISPVLVSRLNLNPVLNLSDAQRASFPVAHYRFGFVFCTHLCVNDHALWLYHCHNSLLCISLLIFHILMYSTYLQNSNITVYVHYFIAVILNK